MFKLVNEELEISIDPKGAELTRIRSRKADLDYLWDGNPKFWAKHSPLLFPIVGTLKDQRYLFDNKTYHLDRHGFARDMDFAMTEQTPDSIRFTLDSDAGTLEKFPFPFRLSVVYHLEQDTLSTRYEVTNIGSHEMYFSIGGHPAFRVPLDPRTVFDDYYLHFETAETAGRWPISTQGLIEALPTPMLNGRALAISHELFSKDALVFKYLNSGWVKLLSDKTSHGLTFHFGGFPFLGLWSGNNGDFLCIEPWCGIADSVASDNQLIEKEGINMITPGQVFNKEWSVQFF